MLQSHRHIAFAATVALVLPLTAATPGGSIIRGIYADPGPALENRTWSGYGQGYDEDAGQKHAGRASIRCVNATDQEAHGAWQAVRFNQSVAHPIVVAGWARLEGVSGDAGYRNSVYLDLRLANGQSWPMRIAAFDPTKAGWQYAEQVHTPPSPVESARVYVFLRERKGTAWFDDIYVGEVLDDKDSRSPNRLIDPGFEGEWPDGVAPRDRFFGKLTEIGANAFHLYRGVGWEKIAATSADAATPPLPEIAPTDPFLAFVQEAHRRGFKVWLTPGLGLPAIRDAKDPLFPFWPCVNGPWGVTYSRAAAWFAQYGVDAVGVVPDEWNYDTSAVEGLAKHADAEVAAFYAKRPPYCDCPTCRAAFRQRTGQDYPDVRRPWSTPDPVWAEFTRFRYDSTAAWVGRTVAAIHAANPAAVTDTMICVLPVCSDDRRHTGAAWDQIGAETGLDCLQTDPYIQLHNYLGDSTHWYPTETVIHLAAANWKGTAGVTLEACRLYDYYRDKEPVEVYGSALSCLAHGATEFFWWHLNYLLGRESFVDPAPPSRQLAAVYRVIREFELDVLRSTIPGDLAVLYSRRSEDAWHWLGDKRPGVPPEAGKADLKRGFVSHRNVLYWLLRRGYPFRTTFLEHPDPAVLANARLLVVPFPFCLSASECELLTSLATEGRTLVLMSELGAVDELGRALPTPALARLFGDQPPDLAGSAPVEARVGRATVVFCPGNFAVGLLEPTAPMKDPKGTVPLPPFAADRTALLDGLLAARLGNQARLFAEPPAQDVEAVLLRDRDRGVLLLTNWDATSPARFRLRAEALSGASSAAGLAISRDAGVRDTRISRTEAGWSVELPAQESCLLRLR